MYKRQRVDAVRDVQRAILKSHGDDVLRSIVKNLMIYALGRPLDVTDDEIIQTIIDHLKAHDHGARELVKALVLSPSFLEK